MERFFQILAVILAGVAAYFLWQGSADRAFVTAIFGAVSFFLSVRTAVKGRLTERDAARQVEWEEEEAIRRAGEAEIEGEFEDSEPPQLNEFPAKAQTDSERTLRATDNE